MTFDYIIAGGGSSACVAASRLVRQGSAMPMIPSGNTNAPALAMGWRAASLITDPRP